MSPSSLKRVHVVGANANGYITAILLLLQGYKVTLVAESFPGDDLSNNYASDDTTSQWQTDTSLSQASLSLQQYDITSFNMFWKLAKSKAKEAGIRVGNSFKYYQEPTADQSNPWWKHMVPGFQMINRQDLPNNIQLGYHYTTVMINPKKFLCWLQVQFLAMGGKQRKTKLNKLLDAVTEQDRVQILVNCSDQLQLDSTARDDLLEKVEQQQWIIKASQIRKSVQVKTKEEELYVYPRMDGTVVIGSKRRQQHHKQANRNARDIINKLVDYCPELTWGKGIDGLDIIDQQTTIKWIRQQGPRIENQFTVAPFGGRIAVTHNYGHDGYQSTWGSSKRAVHLVNEAYATLKKDSESVSALLAHL
ncbi:uncharacterized protein BX664DRAFT_322596 [Halteromyces radiatus]|uniref:uncharacterized protein n=1 Tax=Halteromyces radiatus TaxID=101107 RepID=UPI002220B9D1|nr:uncharacterized protein BX664DRAFT_322596 [Halteromyces radiatus]KAI8099996.1 hypothetical protein BX664DRAFT_322596 [Halteromyces radiatus]